MEHVVTRTLAVKLQASPELFTRLTDLSWQAARYRNLFLRARWAEAMHLCVDPAVSDPHQVSKWIRRDEKQALSGGAYSAAEREAEADWQRHKRRILAGAPLPECKPTAALSLRGHRLKQESSVRLSTDDAGHYVVHLQAQAHTCEGGSWLVCPLATGTVKDFQAPILAQMCTWEVPIRKASILVKPMRRQVLVRLAYQRLIALEPQGSRRATLGPIEGHRLMLRLPTETRDYSGKLHTLLQRKDDWDAVRRRVVAQIGRRKGSARRKRQVLARLSWDEWLQTYLHTWSRELIAWCADRGIGQLRVVGLERADWPAYRFTQLLTYKGDEAGITVMTEADLADPTVERAVKQQLGRQRRRVRRTAEALRNLQHAIQEA